MSTTNIIFEEPGTHAVRGSVWHDGNGNFGTFAPSHFMVVAMAKELMRLREACSSAKEFLESWMPPATGTKQARQHGETLAMLRDVLGEGNDGK